MKEDYIKTSHKGLRLLEKKRYKRGFAIFQRLTEQFPSHFFVWYNFGLVSNILTRYEMAKTAYEMALSLSPHDSLARNELALTLYHLGQLNEAEKQIQTAIKEDPQNPLLHNTLGIINFNQENYPLAREEFKQATQLDPEYKEAWFNLKDTYQMLSDPKGEEIASFMYEKLEGENKEKRSARWKFGKKRSN